MAIPVVALAGAGIRAAVAHVFAPRPVYGAPPATDLAVMAWDGARRDVVMATGPGGAVSDASTWTWDGNGWVQHARSFQPPVGQRFPVTTAYDPSRKIVVAVVADVGNTGPADTWTWDGAAWQQEGGAGDFIIRGGAALGYDDAHHQLILASVDVRDDELVHTWVWQGAEWAALPATAMVPPGPLHLAFDPTTHRLLLFPTAFSKAVDTCVQPIGAASAAPVPPCPPQATRCVGCPVHPLAWTGSEWVPSDMTARDGTVVADPTGGGLLDVVDGDGAARGLWRWDGRHWAARAAGLPLPSTVSGWHLAPDPDADQLVLFGGTKTNGGWSATEAPIDQTWTFDGHAWTQRAGSPLPKLPPPATPPPPPPCSSDPASLHVQTTPSGGAFITMQLPVTGQPGSCTVVPASLRLESMNGGLLAVQGNPASVVSTSPFVVASGSASWANWCGSRSGLRVRLVGAGFDVTQPVASPPVCASGRSPSTLTVFRQVMEP